ncbi:MAG TPA: hypothetical protein VGF84_02860 [Micromonosporaceae bacterium]|jgi:hypothetical protein
MLPPVQVSYAVLAELADALEEIARSLSSDAETAALDVDASTLPRSGFTATSVVDGRIDSAVRTVRGLSVSVTDAATAVHRVVSAYSGSDDRARRRQPW